MNAPAVLLRRNLVEVLPRFDAERLGVLLEAVADELLSRALPGAWSVRAVAWSLLDCHVGVGGNLPAIYSGACVPVRLSDDCS